MKKSVSILRPSRPGEQGFTLLAVILLLAMFTIALSVALPNIAKQIQRDREVETMHRGLQYARAIKLYYEQFGAYPPNVDAVVKGVNDIRYLRKKYTDPMTGKDDWKPILFGQNKTPTAMGFFGQALAGSTVAGTGPGGSNGVAGASSVTGGSSFGSSFFDSGSSSTGASSSMGASSSIGASSTIGASSAMGGASSSGSGSSSSASGSSSTGLSGQTFGGAGIIGFSPGCPKESILIYKKKNHYNQWEFVYDPLADQMMQGGNAGTIGQSASSLSGSSTGSNAATPGTSTTSTGDNFSGFTTGSTQP
ncbi:MAG: type II secretion system protein [Terracidiphilus sp.]